MQKIEIVFSLPVRISPRLVISGKSYLCKLTLDFVNYVVYKPKTIFAEEYMKNMVNNLCFWCTKDFGDVFVGYLNYFDM